MKTYGCFEDFQKENFMGRICLEHDTHKRCKFLDYCNSFEWLKSLHEDSAEAWNMFGGDEEMSDRLGTIRDNLESLFIDFENVCDEHLQEIMEQCPILNSES